MGKIAVSLGSLPILALELEESPVRIGRSADNEIVLPLPEVADHHAELSVSEEGCQIRAAAGESVRHRERSVAKVTLGPGDEVGLGGYRLKWIGTEMGEVLRRARSHGTKPLEPADTTIKPATFLEVIEGKNAGARIPLEAAISTVGRSPECDLVLEDESVSWRHCSMELTREGIRVRDLESSNGTFLDGRRIESALAGAGNKVKVGATVFKFAAGEAEVAAGDEGFAELVGDSVAMRTVYAQIQEAASTRIPVLVSGETGTGKELVARAIHSVGARSSGPFVPVNCAAIPRDMLEDELFGHVKGAFTGAVSDRQGALERADGGTVLLDEVGELAADLQVKLLRVLEDGEVPRLGGAPIASDFRIIAATNRTLRQSAAEGAFRQDLYFRLAVIEIEVPPLRERPSDIAALAQHFLVLAEEEGLTGAAAISLGEDILARLSELRWPGNVRELRNLILRLAMAAKSRPVDMDLLERLISQSAIEQEIPTSAELTLEQMERQVIRRALEDCGGQKRAAARRLGIAESTLYEKIRRFDLR